VAPTDAGSFFELKDASIDGLSCRIYPRAPRSLNDIYRRALGMGAAPLIVSATGRLSYRQTFEEVARQSAMLRWKLGAGPGVRIGIATRDPVQWIVSFLAVTSAGATAVLLPESQLLSSIDELRSIPVIPMETPPACPPGSISLESLPPEQEALITFTSGTTGTPKGAVSTHLAVVTGLMNTMLSAVLAKEVLAKDWTRDASRVSGRPRRTPCTLLLSPLSHLSGYGQLLLTLMSGGRLVMMPSWDRAEVSRVLDLEQVGSIVGATPAQLLELARARAQPASLFTAAMSGAELHLQFLRELAAEWPDLVIGTAYGLTETNGSIAAAPASARFDGVPACGRVVPAAQVRVVGDDGCERRAGEMGEIWVRGASLMSGYCGSSSGLIDRWFRTGDLGALSTESCLSIAGRFSESMFIDGRRILASQIARAVGALPGVDDVAAIFARRPRDSRRLLLIAVVPRPGALSQRARIRNEALTMSCLPADQVDVVQCDKLPRNSRGKLDERELRARFVQCR
jgi:long-chain acyl-CoA synthetase